MSTRIALALALSIVIAGCGDETASPVEGLVVVQETNLTSCMQQHSQSVSVVRTCDGTTASVQICSDVALCDAQVEDLTRRVRACEAPEEPERLTTTAACPE